MSSDIPCMYKKKREKTTHIYESDLNVHKERAESKSRLVNKRHIISRTIIKLGRSADFVYSTELRLLNRQKTTD